MAEYTPVVFENSLGEEISNDPVWHARRTLAAAGETLPSEQQGRPAVGVEEDSDDDESIDARDYKELKGQELKDYAAEREVDITGLKTVGEVRQALIADDIRLAAEAEVERANSEQDEEDEK